MSRSMAERESRQRARRVAIVAGAALLLTGCVILPPPIVPPGAAPSTPASSDSPIAPPSSTGFATQPLGDGGDGFGPFTVDDGHGDVWTYVVTGYQSPAQLEGGVEAPDGYVALALVVDATHDSGSSSWGASFVTTVPVANVMYTSDDVLSLGGVGVHDIVFETGSFTDGQIIVVVPEDATAGTFVVSSVAGEDDRAFSFPA